jgi:DNA-binding GntR family transcriptional regulator
MVRPLDVAAMEQIYAVRRVLEVLAVELASSQSRTPQFRQFMEEVKLASEKTDDTGGADMREEFHERLAAFAGNELLTKFIREINNRIYWTRRLDHYAPDQFRWNAQKEHYQILQLMTAGRVSEAKELMGTHIGNSEAAVKALALPGRPILFVPNSDSGNEPGRIKTKR